MVKDNYDSGRNRLGADENSGNNMQVFDAVEGMMPMNTSGNQTTMNLNPLLLGNIRTNDYFKQLAEKRTFEELVDQIYYDCKMAVPWLPGTHNQKRTSGMCSAARGVSAAGIPTPCFMLLFKLFTLKPAAQQITMMLNHPDSPYIRVIGFLFIRFCCDPKMLWGWYEKYFEDDQEFHVLGEKADKRTITIGAWLRAVVLDQEYHDTMMPRIPVPVMREMQQKLDQIRANQPEEEGWAGEGNWGNDRGEDRHTTAGKGGGGYQGSNYQGGGGNNYEGSNYQGSNYQPNYRDLDAPPPPPQQHSGGGGHHNDRDAGAGRSRHGERSHDDRGHDRRDSGRGSDRRDDRKDDRRDRRDRDEHRDRRDDKDSRRDRGDRDKRRERDDGERKDDRERSDRRDRKGDRDSGKDRKEEKPVRKRSASKDPADVPEPKKSGAGLAAPAEAAAAEAEAAIPVPPPVKKTPQERAMEALKKLSGYLPAQKASGGASSWKSNSSGADVMKTSSSHVMKKWGKMNKR